MAISKKEQAKIDAKLEAALKLAALRWTGPVLPDVPIPPSFNDLSKGFTPVGPKSDYSRVEPACSSSIFHGIGRQDKTTSQSPLSLYSTRLLALRALRHQVEEDCANRLYRIDLMIEEESAKTALPVAA